MSDFDVGQVIAGKYELVRLLGQGAMGSVWLAKHHTLDEKFALKLVRTDIPELGVDPGEAAGRFQQEAQLSASLSRRTRHIVQVSDHGEYDGWAYLVMEALEGESLEERLRRGAIPPAETVDIIGQVARALTVAHGDLVYHRDLKPANIFLVRDEEGRLLVKLLDFGIARSIRPKATRSQFATTKDVVLGTPSYMSPEQARGLESLDHRCDLWALAVVAYECLTGTTPWEGGNVQEVFLAVCTHQWVPARHRSPDLPFVVDAVFSRAFAFELDERFGSAKELAATLRAAFPTATSAQGGRTAFASRTSFSEDEIAGSFGGGAAPASAPTPTPAGPPVSIPLSAGMAVLPEGSPVDPTLKSDRNVLANTDDFLAAGIPRRRRGGFVRLVIGASVAAFLLLAGIAVWWGVFETSARATSPTPLTSPSPPALVTAPDPALAPPDPRPDEAPTTPAPADPKPTTTKPVTTVNTAAKLPATSTRPTGEAPKPTTTPPPADPAPSAKKPRGPHDRGEVF